MKISDHYKTSSDYISLLGYMSLHPVICIVIADGMETVAVAKTIGQDARAQFFVVGVLGTGYCYAYTAEDFIKQCEKCNLVFLESTKYTQKKGC